ncbi:MAG: helix-turn-helix domain-containing protein, partial [Nocardioidaceae bacterium]|nr:helix-turn-helix domain-containing protein [Nocardioidaceae bacterium]
LVSTQEVGALLGVTEQQVRRLAEAGAINRVARGLIDRQSVERYLASGRGGRTRVWAETTAWGAIALLSGRPAEWLTPAQASRVRLTLRATQDPRELAARLRGRATVSTYAGDFTAEAVIQERLDDPDGLGPLLVGTRPGHLDGYIAADELSRIVRILEMRPDPDGTITLRSTSFDMARVRRLSEASPVLAACDDVASMDQRRRADAECALGAALQVVPG